MQTKKINFLQKPAHRKLLLRRSPTQEQAPLTSGKTQEREKSSSVCLEKITREAEESEKERAKWLSNGTKSCCLSVKVRRRRRSQWKEEKFKRWSCDEGKKRLFSSLQFHSRKLFHNCEGREIIWLHYDTQKLVYH